MGCPPRVRSALSKVEGVEEIDVGLIDRETKTAIVKVKGNVTPAALIASFEGTQYSAKLP